MNAFLNLSLCQHQYWVPVVYMIVVWSGEMNVMMFTLLTCDQHTEMLYVYDYTDYVTNIFYIFQVWLARQTNM